MSEQTHTTTAGVPEIRRNRIARVLSTIGQASQAGAHSLYAGRGKLLLLLAVGGVVFGQYQESPPQKIGLGDLPADYKRGTANLLAEENAPNKVPYILEMKEKLVKQRELASEAEKVKREKNAEAAAQEAVIAARAQEVAMKNILPFKPDIEHMARFKPNRSHCRFHCLGDTAMRIPVGPNLPDNARLLPGV